MTAANPSVNSKNFTISTDLPIVSSLSLPFAKFFLIGLNKNTLIRTGGKNGLATVIV